MPKQKITEIEQAVSNAKHLSDEQKNHLHALLHEVKHQLESVPVEHEESAADLAGYAHQTALQVLKPEQDAGLIGLAEQDAKAKLEEYERSHPKLFSTIQTLIISLSSLGV